MSKTKEHLDFIYNRMLEVHGENENVDYMLKFKSIIDNYFSDAVKSVKNVEVETPDRFFFVSYSYFKENSSGFGSLTFKGKEFPSRRFLTKSASEFAVTTIDKIVITSIQELSAEDFASYRS
jgi:hypothetical protein